MTDKKSISKIRKVLKWILYTFLILVALTIVGGIAGWSYWVYVNRPQPVYSLKNISLGDSKVDVTLEHGSPSLVNTEESGREILFYTDAYGNEEFYVDLNKSSLTNGEVNKICSKDYNDEVFGLGVYDREDKVIKKLGTPNNVSIDESGLEKAISYPEYNVVFVIKEGNVVMTCVSSKIMKYKNEYQWKN